MCIVHADVGLHAACLYKGMPGLHCGYFEALKCGHLAECHGVVSVAK